MPIFMDLHNVPGVTPKEVAEAHGHDVKIQDEFSCRTMTYWMDVDKGCVFCLIEAPDKESVKEMHKKAHGLIPNDIIEVDSNVVKAFLGRIQDPETVQKEHLPLKVFSDPAFRIIVATKTIDARLLQHTLGAEKAKDLMLLYHTLANDQTKLHGGNRVEMQEEGFVISFTDVNQAIECALAIQQRLRGVAEVIGLRLAIHAGVPLDGNEMIFGSTIQLARYLCTLGNDNQILMSSAVRNLYKESKLTAQTSKNIRCLSLAEENFLEELIKTLNQHWQNQEFSVEDFCSIMSTSKPQLYRKIKSLTGLSPNSLLREYRLLRALDLLRNEDRNITQTAFDAGFSSPSYFTKCFQNRFAIQPLAYLKTR
jgi:AraC-like DNA-binding protein